MNQKPGPNDLRDIRYILTPSSDGILRPVTSDFYEGLAEFGDFRGHALIQRFDFETPWPTWEVHPEGDEFVYLLSGDTDFLLRIEGADQTVRVDTPGQFVVVPRGTWHTARPHAPTSMLFVTPGAGTLNASEPPV